MQRDNEQLTQTVARAKKLSLSGLSFQVLGLLVQKGLPLLLQP